MAIKERYLRGRNYDAFSWNNQRRIEFMQNIFALQLLVQGLVFQQFDFNQTSKKSSTQIDQILLVQQQIQQTNHQSMRQEIIITLSQNLNYANQEILKLKDITYLANEKKKYQDLLKTLVEPTKKTLQNQIQIVKNQISKKIQKGIQKNNKKKFKFEGQRLKYIRQVNTNKILLNIKDEMNNILKNFRCQTLNMEKQLGQKNYQLIRTYTQEKKQLQRMINQTSENEQQTVYIKEKIKMFIQQIEETRNFTEQNIKRQIKIQYTRAQQIANTIKNSIKENIQSIKANVIEDVQRIVGQIEHKEDPQENEQKIVDIGKQQICSIYFLLPLAVIFIYFFVKKQYPWIFNQNSTLMAPQKILDTCNIQPWPQQLWKIHLAEILGFVLPIFGVLLIVGIWKRKFNRNIMLTLLFICFAIYIYLITNHDLQLDQRIYSKNLKCIKLLTKKNDIQTDQKDFIQTQVQNQIQKFLIDIHQNFNKYQNRKISIVTGQAGVGKTSAVKQFLDTSYLLNHVLFYNLENVDKDQIQNKIHQENKLNFNEKQTFNIQLPIIDEFMKISFNEIDKIHQLISIIHFVSYKQRQPITMVFDQVNSLINEEKFLLFIRKLGQQVKINPFFKVVIVSTEQNPLGLTRDQAITLKVKRNKSTELQLFLKNKFGKNFTIVTNYSQSFREAEEIIHLCNMEQEKKVSQASLKKCLQKYIKIQENIIRDSLKQINLSKKKFCQEYQQLSPYKIRHLMNNNILYDRSRLYNRRSQLAFDGYCNQPKNKKQKSRKEKPIKK